MNGRVRYSITSGDTNRDFSIAEDTGVVRVAKNLNYERKSRYVLVVRAEDCAGDISGDAVRSDTAEISISVSDINDNPPTFLDSPYLAYVMENTIPPVGGYIVTVQVGSAEQLLSVLNSGDWMVKVLPLLLFVNLCLSFRRSTRTARRSTRSSATS